MKQFCGVNFGFLSGFIHRIFSGQPTESHGVMGYKLQESSFIVSKNIWRKWWGCGWQLWEVSVGSSALDFRLSLFDEGSLSKKHALGMRSCDAVRVSLGTWNTAFLLISWSSGNGNNRKGFTLKYLNCTWACTNRKQKQRSTCFMMIYCSYLFQNKCDRTNQTGGQKHCKCFVRGSGKIK